MVDVYSVTIKSDFAAQCSMFTYTVDCTNIERLFGS